MINLANPKFLKPAFNFNEMRVKDILLNMQFNKSVRPITVDANSGIIINGHNRFEALKRLNIKKIPIWSINIDNCTFINTCTMKEINSFEIRSFAHTKMDANEIYVEYKNKNISIEEPHDFFSFSDLMVKVFTVGVFDLFHVGHINLLKKARSLGDHLTVGVQYNVEKFKNQKIHYDFNDRFFFVSSLQFVDLAVAYENIADAIKKVSFDIFACGPDQNHIFFKEAFRYCEETQKEIVIIPRTEGISSTKLRLGMTSE
jgi:glycerol-3-phosphate cytidylyltransferase